MVFSPVGTILATAANKTIRLWDIESGKQKKAFKGHTQLIIDLSFSPDGKMLASIDFYGVIRLWDIESGKRLGTIRTRTGGLSNIEFSSDSKTLLSVFGDRSFKLWDVATFKQKQTNNVKGDEPKIDNLSKLSPDFQTVATSLSDRKGWTGPDFQIGLWDVASGEFTHTLIGHTKSITSIAFSPDSNMLISSANDDTIRMWDVASGEQKLIITRQDFPSPPNVVWQTVVWDEGFSSDGRILTHTTGEGHIHLWDSSTGEHKKTLKGHTDRIVSLSFSIDSNILVSKSKDGTVLVWDLATK